MTSNRGYKPVATLRIKGNGRYAKAQRASVEAFQRRIDDARQRNRERLALIQKRGK